MKNIKKKTDNDENVIRNFNRQRTDDSLVAFLFENTVSQIPPVNFATNSIGIDGIGSTEDLSTIAFDSRTTAATETTEVGMTEGSARQDTSRLKSKETLKTYLTLLDNELMENKDTIALYLFQNATKDISHLLEHYIYKNTINARTKKHLKILSEIVRFGYF